MHLAFKKTSRMILLANKIIMTSPRLQLMTMKASVVFLLHLAFVSALNCHIPAACPNLPSITVEDACRKATGTLLMYELCKDALRDVAYPCNGVDLYALVAVKRALASYDDTASAAGDLLRGNGSLTGDERDAYALCVEAYREAGVTMEGVAAALIGCRFGEELGQVYRDGIAQLERCRDRLMKLPSSPLYAMNLVDRNKAVLAYFLGRLLGHGVQ